MRNFGDSWNGKGLNSIQVRESRPRELLHASEGFLWGAFAWVSAPCVGASFSLTGGQRGFSPGPDLAPYLHGDLT